MGEKMLVCFPASDRIPQVHESVEHEKRDACKRGWPCTQGRLRKPEQTRCRHKERAAEVADEVDVGRSGEGNASAVIPVHRVSEHPQGVEGEVKAQ